MCNYIKYKNDKPEKVPEILYRCGKLQRHDVLTVCACVCQTKLRVLFVLILIICIFGIP